MRAPWLTWVWPILILLSTSAVTLLIFWFPEVEIRPPVIMCFLFLIPGMTVVRFFRTRDTAVEWMLAIALSFAIDAFVAGIVLYAGQWSPIHIMSFLIGFCFAGAIAQLVIIRPATTVTTGSLPFREKRVGASPGVRPVPKKRCRRLAGRTPGDAPTLFSQKEGKVRIDTEDVQTVEITDVDTQHLETSATDVDTQHLGDGKDVQTIKIHADTQHPDDKEIDVDLEEIVDPEDTRERPVVLLPRHLSHEEYTQEKTVPLAKPQLSGKETSRG